MAPKSLCLITALAPVPAFLGGSCPLGCSLSAPATGGFSVVSPQCACMRQAPRRRSGPAAHFMGYHSTIVRILQGGCGITWTGGLVVACALLQRGDWLGVRRCPTGPPSDAFGNRGTHHTPAEATPPAPCVGTEGALACLGASGPLPNLPSYSREGRGAAPGGGGWDGGRRRGWGLFRDSLGKV